MQNDKNAIQDHNEVKQDHEKAIQNHNSFFPGYDNIFLPFWVGFRSAIKTNEPKERATLS